ncbi:MAG: 50S ribosomal protein L24 [Candidatus Dasytiphilus stammeri]
MAAKIRYNDQVIIITGKDKGKRGKVKKIFYNDKNCKIIVEGVNLIKKHQKAVPAINRSGGIISTEAAVHISNVAIYNVSRDKADRIGFIFKDGKKLRILKSNNQILE